MKSSSEVFASVEFQYSVSAESLSKWALFSDSPRLLCGGRVPDPPPLPVICPGVTNAGDTRDIGHPGHSYSRTSTCWSSSEPNGFSKIISITAHRLKKSPYPTFGDKNYILVWRISIILYFFWCLLLILIWDQVYSKQEVSQQTAGRAVHLYSN